MQQKGPVNLFVQLLQQRSNSESVSSLVERRMSHGSFLYKRDDMNRDYYIAQTHFIIHSDVPLESYEAEEKFTHPAIPALYDIDVQIALAEKIEVPDGDYIEDEFCKIWLEQGLEIRLYDFQDTYPDVIRSEWDGKSIRIWIQDVIGRICMKNFRPWSYMHLERVLLQHHALILHSASILYQEKAILFTAPSETGKTTQTDIWHRKEASVQDLNGDRTVLLPGPEGWIACGIPISGTSDRCEQISAPIAGIVLVSRAEIDSVSELSVVEKVRHLYDQITVCSASAPDAERALDLIMDLIGSERMLKLNCTMKDSAYHVLKKALF